MLVHKLETLLSKQITVHQGKQIHGCMIISRLHYLEPLLIRQILLPATNYSTSLAQYVRGVLYRLQNPDAFSWSCTIRYFSQEGQFEDSFRLYVEMLRVGVCPSTFAVCSTLRACGRISYATAGCSIHAQAYKYGFGSCVYVQTALVDLYSKLGAMDTAQKAFDDIADKNVVSWNSILSGYLKSGNLDEAKRVFDQIPAKDVVSWNSMLSGYAKVGNMDEASIIFQQMPERNYASWNAMISGLVDCGKIETARSYFDKMPSRNNISWITMISGYSKCGDVESANELFRDLDKKDLLSFNAMISCLVKNSRPQEALQLFSEMLKTQVNIHPDKITLVSVISACSQLGDLTYGSWIESYIRNARIDTDDQLNTALIDLYAKCGNIQKANEMFNSLNKKDVVAYSAMISGFGMNGKINEAIKLFEAMKEAQVPPNLATFTGLLSGYCHAGMVEEGYKCFHTMKDHNLVPSNDHYAIMADLFGRAGRLEEAYEMIKSMPMQPNAGVWGGLLLACKVHNNIEIGEVAAKHCLELEPDTAAYYSLLANIYASAGKWADVTSLRKAVKEKQLGSLPGSSWIEWPT
ncbi:Pentatricopeptide repeat-containing protein At4g22760 [Linum grandiflorum]